MHKKKGKCLPYMSDSLGIIAAEIQKPAKYNDPGMATIELLAQVRSILSIQLMKLPSPW
jgi:hypothetical protein